MFGQLLRWQVEIKALLRPRIKPGCVGWLTPTAPISAAAASAAAAGADAAAGGGHPSPGPNQLAAAFCGFAFLEDLKERFPQFT